MDSNKIRKLTDDINDIYKKIKDENCDIKSKEMSQMHASTCRLRGLLNKLQKRNLLKSENEKSYNSKHYCYICKIKIEDKTGRMHYTNMCEPCIDIHIEKRTQEKDLTGKIAVITGGRVKIGFETAIRLLKNGCTVIVTSR